MKRKLVLEDGSVFIGTAFGGTTDTIGEVVFTTGMSGYQETISDLSLCGQIVTMTYPLIGNCGINRDDFESIKPSLKGLIVREVCDYPSNFRSEKTLDTYLKEWNIPGISGIDTRMLTRLIRKHGTLKGAIINTEINEQEVINQLNQTSLATNQVEQVSISNAYPSPGRGYKIVLVDFGMKHGILRELTKRGCDVVVVPYNTDSKTIFQLNPDGVMLSNGPGDPKSIPSVIVMVKEILGKIPLTGICLGHLLFALACDANTTKLKFGHRGSNHPVIDLNKNKVVITTQSHGFAVDTDSLKNTDLEITHIALNDKTIEGIKHNKLPAFTVQFHPESSGGPEDANYIFDEFIEMIAEFKKGGNNNA